jgi:hypothetical protein
MNSVPQHTGPQQDQDHRRVLKRLLEVHRPLELFTPDTAAVEGDIKAPLISLYYTGVHYINLFHFEIIPSECSRKFMIIILQKCHTIFNISILNIYSLLIR